MTLDQGIIFSILATVLILFIWGKWRYDIVAFGALFCCVIFGLIPSDQAFLGFGHPATITVAIVLVLGHGLTKSGAVEGIAYLISPLAKIPTLQITVLIFIAAFLSMFMNNVGALALLMPIAITSSLQSDRPPSAVLMPLSFGSILGGMVTVIGTPPNIIIATYRGEVTGQDFTMFDFSYAGGLIALIGIIFISTIGWRLIKVRKTNVGISLFEYVFEIKLSRKSELVNKNIKDLELILNRYDINIVSLIYKSRYYPVPYKGHILTATDIIILEGNHENIDKFVSKYDLNLLGAENAKDAVKNFSDTILTEVVLGPNSSLENRIVKNIKFKNNHNINLLAISRKGKSITQRLREVKLMIGDILLLHGEKDTSESTIDKLGCLPLAERGVEFGKRKFSILALSIFFTSIVMSILNIFPLQICLGLAVMSMVFFNIIPIKEIYNAIDWPVIVLIGAMIPVGSALETTGATDLIAQFLLSLTQNLSPIYLLAIIMIITMTLSDILNNVATAILMAPIAKNVAIALGVSIDPFLMAVAIGASCAFLTPIGHQNNTLVMVPGNYRFGDYWRMGLPLEIIIIIVSIPILQIFWPL